MRSDLVHAIHGLARRPSLALTAILTLAIGIGANTAIFSLVRATLTRPFPFDEPDRLMLVHLLAPAEAGEAAAARHIVWSYPKYRTLLEVQPVFAAVAAYRQETPNLTDTADPEQLQAESVSASYLPLLGIRPIHGRTFTEADDAPGSPRVALVSYSLWKRRFAGDPGAVGRTITLNRDPHTIVGVLPEGFPGLTGAAEIWVAVGPAAGDELGQRWSHSFSVVGRLKAGVSEAQAVSSMTVVGRQVDDAHPMPGGGTSWSATAERLDEARVDPAIRTSVLVLFGAVGFVLLIACVNLAALLVARSASREREIAVRMALGAGRSRLVRLLMTESLVLSIAGAAAGLALAWWGVGVFRDIGSEVADGVFRTRRSGLTKLVLSGISLDMVTLGVSLGLAFLTALLFGLLPALRLTRPRIAEAIKDDPVGLRAGGRHRWTSGLVVVEIGLATVLLAGAGLMLRTVGELRALPIGFDADGLVTFRLTLPAPQYETQSRALFIERALDRIRALPGVETAGVNTCVPLSSRCNGTVIWFRDRPPVPSGTEPAVGVHSISVGYLEALKVPLVRGRLFTERDRLGAPKVVLVSAEAARRFWPGDDPVGRPVAVGQGGFHDRAEVVGVVADVQYGAVAEPIGPAVYMPALQAPRTSSMVVLRSRLGPGAVVPGVRAAIQSIDPNLPLVDVRTMDERADRAIARARLTAIVLTAFAGVALGLAAIGIYGVLSWLVQLRTREIGIRMALGARHWSVVRLVVGRALALVAGGLVVGLGGSLALTRVLRTLLFRVQPTDAPTLALAVVALTAVALTASYLPARRAASVDPVRALRGE